MIKIVTFVICWSIWLHANTISQWYKDYPEALKMARKHHAPLFVLVQSDRCKWCQKLKTSTLQNPTVQTRLQNYIKVIINRSDLTSLRFLRPVEGVPTLFFVSHEGKIVMEALGYVDVKEFLSLIADSEAIMAQSQ